MKEQVKAKEIRFQLIRKVLKNNKVANQDELLVLMAQNGCQMTQSTLSRDLKELNVSKMALPDGVYRYVLPRHTSAALHTDEKGFVSIAFSGQMAVVKTRPGYASRLAYEIDEKASDVIIGTVAGEDTVLLVVNENSSREQVIAALSAFIKL